MKIVPAILADNIEDFFARLRQAESFVDYVQIDLMDGIFVPTRSFPGEMINDINSPLSFELHLMVRNPAAFMSRIDNPHVKKVLFHIESDVEHLNFISQIRQKGISPGIAIKPATEIKEFREVGERVDTLLFLTVDPGWYGSSFKPDVLRKIEEARQVFKDKIIAVDGGISLDNLKLFVNLGVDYVCVGSKIFLEGLQKKIIKLS